MEYIWNAALQNAGYKQQEMPYYYQGGSSPQEKLKEQLYHCTYPDE
jgi:hypothetical protein